MDHDEFNESAPSETWLFAQSILGRPIGRFVSPVEKARAKRAELERLAPFSAQHAEALRELDAAEAKARRDRELLEWAASISTRAAEELRALQRKEEQEREAWRRAQRFYESLGTELVEWNETDHPRQPKGASTGGQFAPKGGGGGGATSVGSTSKTVGGSPKRPLGAVTEVSPDPSNPSHWYLPSDDKGEWLGKKGDSKFRLKSPANVNGKLVHEIEFTKGVPVLDKFALSGNTATIILTGDHDTDLRHAKAAWHRLNPGKDFPKNATFHHDLLNATEVTRDIGGKKVKVLVGKMQLVPRAINEAVFHQGSASVAKKFYQGLGVDVNAISRLAKDEANRAGPIIAKALGKIKPGKIPKGLIPLVGRNILKAIPLVGSGLAVLEFAENAEAHGVGGAIVRATPVLGDLVSAADLGADLAKQIRDDADSDAWTRKLQLNEPSRKAWEEADKQTIAAFQDLAPQIQVTNPPQSDGGAGLVDPNEIAAALHEYREAMQNLNWRRNENMKGVNFNADAAHNKKQLRRRLERASQRRAPRAQGPTA